jgi:hypothetical protein
MRTPLIVVGMVMLLVVVVSIGAQEQEMRKEFQPAQLAADLKARLQLTEDQVAQIRPLLKEQMDTLRTVIEDYKEQGMAGPQALKAEMQKFRDDLKAKIVPLLTDDQQQKLQAYFEELREKANKTIQDRFMEKLAERLKLTEEQIKQIAPIMKENAEKRRELVEKFQEQGREALKAFREEHQQMEQETAQRLKDLLNAEQLQEFQKIQDELKEKIRQRIFERRQQK